MATTGVATTGVESVVNGEIIMLRSRRTSRWRPMMGEYFEEQQFAIQNKRVMSSMLPGVASCPCKYEEMNTHERSQGVYKSKRTGLK